MSDPDDCDDYDDECDDQSLGDENPPELDNGDIDPNWEDPEAVYPPHEFGEACDCEVCCPAGAEPCAEDEFCGCDACAEWQAHYATG